MGLRPDDEPRAAGARHRRPRGVEIAEAERQIGGGHDHPALVQRAAGPQRLDDAAVERVTEPGDRLAERGDQDAARGAGELLADLPGEIAAAVLEEKNGRVRLKRHPRDQARDDRREGRLLVVDRDEIRELHAHRLSHCEPWESVIPETA